jgi:hypothetical protein
MFNRTRSPGFWTFSSAIAPAELERIDDYSYAIDGRGGTYAPSSLITIGGSGLTVSGPCSLSDIQAATFNCEIISTKGATITQSTTNGRGLSATGNGTGDGVRGVGGGTSGRGGIFLSSGGNAVGVYCEGSGSGSGLQAVGGTSGNGVTATAGGGNASGISATGAGTGAGVIANAGSSGSAIQANGRITFTGTQPAAGDDPGANAAHAITQAKALANITTTGAGGITLHDGYNIALVEIVGTSIRLTFAREMANANYFVTITGLDGVARFYAVENGGLGTTTCTIVVKDVSGSGINPASSVIKMMVDVKGRQ